jgi:hypothetical protein
MGVLLFWTLNYPMAQTPQMKKIFNGKNLKGWVVPENNIWWSANNGVLFGKNIPKKKGTILWTQKSYKNFIIDSEYLCGDGVVDTGIFLRTEKQQIQMGILGSLKRDVTSSPYIPGKRYSVEKQKVLMNY